MQASNCSDVLMRRQFILLTHSDLVWTVASRTSWNGFDSPVALCHAAIRAVLSDIACQVWLGHALLGMCVLNLSQSRLCAFA